MKYSRNGMFDDNANAIKNINIKRIINIKIIKYFKMFKITNQLLFVVKQ